MESALPIAATAAAVEILRLCIFAYLWRLDRAEHLRWWTLAFAFFTGSQFTVVLLLGSPSSSLSGPLGLFGLLCVVTATMFLLRGTLALVGRRVPIVALLGLGAAATAASGIALTLDVSLPIASAFPMSLLALTHCAMAAALLFGSREKLSFGLWFSVGVLLLSGAHFADFPLLGEVVWFIPYGFGIQLFSTVGITLGFTLLHVERVRSARALSDLRYEELADRLGVGVFQLDRDSRLSRANHALVRMLGYGTLDALQGADVARNIAIEPAAWSALLAKVDAFEQALEVVMAWRTADATELTVEVSARALRDDTGGLCGVRGFVTDRTRAHALEERLRQTQKLEAVGQLAAGVAHDFNNLLTILQATHELIASGPLTDEQQQLLDDASTATDQATRLTRRLLAFGRRQPTTPRVVDLGQIARASMAMARSAFGPKHRVVLDGIADGMWVHADPTHLEQTVLNLAFNARDAMPEGGTLTLRTAPARVQGTEGFELLVTDDGTGIPPENRPRLFEPFFSTKGPGRGTGLGLSTVHGIVVKAGGTVEVESEVDVGTTVRIWLPAAPELESGSEDVRASPAASDASVDIPYKAKGQNDAIDDTPSAKVLRATTAGMTGSVATVPLADRTESPDAPARPRALVADDEPGLRKLIGRLLTDAGYEVTTVSSGRAVVERYEAGERFALLVSDVRMPDIGGAPTARAVRHMAPETRIVLISGFNDELDGAEPDLYDAFLHKPFDRAGLIRVLRE